MAVLIIAWIAYLYGALQFLFHGFRIGGSFFTTAALFAAGFILLVVLTCRRLFKPTRKQRQAADYIVSGLREKGRSGQDP